MNIANYLDLVRAQYSSGQATEELSTCAIHAVPEHRPYADRRK